MLHWINDWVDDDGFFETPDPFFLFNFSVGTLEGSIQISLVIAGLGCVLTFGEERRSEEEDSSPVD